MLCGITPRRLKVFIGAVLSFGLLFGVVLWAGLQNKESGDRKLDPTAFGPCNVTDPNFTFPYNIPLSAQSGVVNGTRFQNVPTLVEIEMSVTSVDPGSSSYRLHFEFTPRGDLADQLVGGGEDLDSLVNRKLRSDLNITVGSITFRFKAGDTMQPQDSAFSITGDINRYPFDKWQNFLLMTGTFRNATSRVDSPVSLVVFANAPLAAYNIVFPQVCDTSSKSDATLILITSVIKRAHTTKVFVVLLTIFMWVLSLLMMTLAVSVWVRGRKVEPPTIAVSISMLFALPSIRNSQPLAPPIGTTVDVVGFFWNMVLVAIAAALLLVNYIYRYTGDGASKQKVEVVREHLTPKWRGEM
ncbi:hypothetical protein SpCBS45565_g06375 [Spizellomyces sp. 'palustris']|nr:hypothetical protein SpCBS45565_g06375 [Spizellomyces sp. 'palustris']